jgi:hypothetical protein
MQHAAVAASVFLALGLTMATGAFAQTKYTNCAHPTPADAGGGETGGTQPEYAQAGSDNGGTTKPAEAGGGNGRQRWYWKSAAAGSCP